MWCVVLCVVVISGSVSIVVVGDSGVDDDDLSSVGWLKNNYRLKVKSMNSKNEMKWNEIK